MNINELLKSDKTWLEKIDILSGMKSALETKITNDIPLLFNIDYIFSKDINNLTWNNQWKEVDLAIKILEFTKKWNRNYNLNLTKKVPTTIFTQFFNNYIGVSIYDLTHKLGCHIYKGKHIATIKTLITWANKLYDNKIINNELLNKFVEYLEDISKGE